MIGHSRPVNRVLVNDATPRPLAELHAPVALGGTPQKRPAHLAGIGRFDDQAAGSVPGDARIFADVCSYNRQTARHCFKQGIAHLLVAAAAE
jgi:hypothetical protein